MIDEYGAFGGLRIGRGNPKYSEKTCSSATLSTTNPIRPDLGSNPGHHGGKLATNHLSSYHSFFSIKSAVGRRKATFFMFD
jgi:hypothetical protein